ncbi:hypothetical protein MAR_030828 [Mya arenaria]|uniref:Uncharacterized protein n=1 Tax=Mya arenaria TaxID=6604 RepID=A0ABY7F5Z9_MYAAR|nr:hypothetical protein MAR_030828 [Mya arenaria]
MSSVLRALNPIEKHAERIDKSLKGHKDLLNMNGIEYPVTLKAIDRFERQNATISVNVFGYENGDIYPLRVSKHEHESVKPRQGLGSEGRALKPRLRLEHEQIVVRPIEKKTNIQDITVSVALTHSSQRIS